MTYSKLKDLLMRFADGFSKHDIMTLAAALAFYTALSLAPLVLLIIAVIGVMGGNYQDEFLRQVQSLMGSDAAGALSLIVKNANAHESKTTLSGIFGTFVLLFSASAVFAQLQASLNVIWEAQAVARQAGWISYLRTRFFSMGMVLALAFLALVSLLLSTVLSAIFVQSGFIWSVLNICFSIVAFSAVFTAIFKFMPDRKVLWRHVVVGGIFTGILFSIGRSLIGIYLGTSALGSAYGAAGSLIVLLAWVYYSAIIVFVGAEFTRSVYSEENDFSLVPASAPKMA